MKTQEYWEKKHPLTLQNYHGRPMPGNLKTRLPVDVRRFIWLDDLNLFEEAAANDLIKSTNDETALAVQQYIVKNYKYIKDDELGCPEYWLFPFETLAMKKGDCEDGSILLASLLVNIFNELDHWRVRVAAGLVEGGGHAYVTYCRETDNEWVILDWCYWEDSEISVAKKPLAKDKEKYKQVWFSFNAKYAWAHDKFNVVGRVHNDK